MNKREKRFKDSTADAAYQWGMNDLFFNKDYFKSAKAFKQHLDQYNSLMKDVLPHADMLIQKYSAQSGSIARKQLAYIEALKATGRSNVSNADPYGTMVHELGHYLDDQIFRNAMKAKGFDISESYQKYARGISGYATADTKEYVAESFLAYWIGERDNIDPGLIEIFEGAKKR